MFHSLCISTERARLVVYDVQTECFVVIFPDGPVECLEFDFFCFRRDEGEVELFVCIIECTGTSVRDNI